MKILFSALLLVALFIPAPVSADEYLNCSSTEPGINSDTNTLFCDDFEDGGWAATDGDCKNPSSGAQITACTDAGSATSYGPNDGWSMTINPPNDFVDPDGTDFGRCGSAGAVGTNCAVTSDEIPSTNGNQIQGEHWFTPAKATYAEVYFRYYLFQRCGDGRSYPCETPASGDFKIGHEKTVNFYTTVGGSNCCISNKFFSTGEIRMQVLTGGGSWLGQNISFINIVNGRWYYIEHHIILETTTSADDGIWQLWIDDCGTTGLDCSGPGTLRSSHTGIDWGTVTGEEVDHIWFENWGNVSSEGEEYYDQIVASKSRIGMMAASVGVFLGVQ